jgi:putative transcriptional regulator
VPATVAKTSAFSRWVEKLPSAEERAAGCRLRRDGEGLGADKEGGAMSKLGDELVEAMREMVDHLESKPTGVVAHRAVPALAPADILATRERTGLSRAKFAERFGLDARALQDSEQGRRRPDRAARVLLKTIALHPEAVDAALAA